MTRLLAALAAAVVALAAAPPVRAGSHFAVEFDTSSSMTSGGSGGVANTPANYSVLAALILRELLDPGDRLDLVTMGGARLNNVSTAQIRSIAFAFIW